MRNRNPTHNTNKKRVTDTQSSEITAAANTEIARLMAHIKKKRTALGYSQEEIAAFLGMPSQKYSKIEGRKTSDFKVYDFIKLCSLLEIDYI